MEHISWPAIYLIGVRRAPVVRGLVTAAGGGYPAICCAYMLVMLCASLVHAFRIVSGQVQYRKRMQDPRVLLLEEDLNPKIRKKKSSANKAPLFPLERNDIKGVQQVQGSVPLRTGKKTSKRNSKNEISPIFQQPERSNSDSLPDSSTSGNEYRALRRKYLLLEEESFTLGKELKDVEDEVKALEDEKLALLDQLVVLEGLIDPSEMQSHGA
ncbi:hypothetical protein Goarm_018255 [Gossypium armourianum]|uniref:Uncharacterized protein n=1 Tax=Gossypium armourianum TaxID=34283 RepID=A0A7J9IHT0_9ROSI|nr:hypothetical protein [Gossypium armourianum]